ncbi:MBL fold metallo-hydrolase [Dyella terrae]|uniref:MBL fold metallo-hydrolase n=1 Tax=Dyella terrae TaxID=522259 RepID=UPI001EFCC58C|nr:MBL fold metallo-hydrolase [Dyella terrae]ULU24174.1 Hydroxyacylglutathione hydrolase [Dyella terrae]
MERSRLRKPQPVGELRYPFDEPPRPGECLTVAPGVQWLRMPLPGALDHINVWLIDEHDGLAIVDTGVRSFESAALWEHMLDPPALRKPRRVLLTHRHADHAGMAGWLASRYGCELWMTNDEYLAARMALWECQAPPSPAVSMFYRRAGWEADALAHYRERHGYYADYMFNLPSQYYRLQDGQVLRIGDHDWTVITGGGHSVEHACLYCPSLRLLIAGDQVLPRISSNVSVMPQEPDANPLAQRIDALQHLRRSVPADVLVLPSHNDCFHGLHVRIDQLLRGQERALQRLREALAKPRRVIDVFRALFARHIASRSSEYTLATGEALACLNYLIARGEVCRERRCGGTHWYRLTHEAATGAPGHPSHERKPA